MISYDFIDLILCLNPFSFYISSRGMYALQARNDLVSFDIRRTLQSQYSIDPVKDQVFRS